MTTEGNDVLGLTTGGPVSAPEPSPGLWVRATVHLPHLARGAHAYVDPRDPDVQHCLRHEQLVPLPGQNAEELLQRFT